ncbi:unnamed protein product [Onchocerca flexuosa]|uniref:Transposase n=1 Tax=Onchocerca flexuosa TaxID=387005 RepID=A0A183HUW5_9BILA|nr:unnamed protein product [Onchocerca flexuosa]
MYPRLHIELAPIYEHLHDQISRFQQPTVTPFDIIKRRRRFDDLLRVWYFSVPIFFEYGTF